MLIHRTFVSRLAEDCENGHIFISKPSISSSWPCEITWNAQVLLKIEYSSPGMKYFKIFMIEHLKNSLRLEILSRNELHVPRGEEELVRMKICASFPASIFETFQKCTKLQLLTCKRLSQAIWRKLWHFLSNSKQHYLPGLNFIENIRINLNILFVCNRWFVVSSQTGWV